MNIILATNNNDKVIELKDKLKINNCNYDVISLNDIDFNEEIEEFGLTFEQNALIKAQAISNKYPKSIIIADDSGLCVEALNNEPGVYSARYAIKDDNYKLDKNKANNQKLKRELKGISNRNAMFKTVICIIKPGSVPIFSVGSVKGYIIDNERGSYGFGYDPLFTHDGLKTFGEIKPEEKLKLSHRSKAIDKIFEMEIL